MTRLFFWAVVAAVLSLSPACSRKGQDEQSKKDAEAFQGEWEVVAAESNGEPPPAGFLLGSKVTLSGNKSTLLGKEGTFELDASKSPRRITFISGKSRQVGIYELDGDNLKWCVGPSDDPPREYKTKPRTNHTLLVMKRKK